MAIETAGEQRYYDFIAARVKKHRLIDISSISIICAGFISFTAKAEEGIFIGLFLIVLGISMEIKNIGSKQDLNKKLDIVDDKKKFFKQLVDKETVEFKDLRLIITNDYVLKYSDDLYIYKLADMKTVEIKNNRLYIVGYDKECYEIAVNEKDKENSFDTASQLLAILV